MQRIRYSSVVLGVLLAYGPAFAQTELTSGSSNKIIKWCGKDKNDVRFSSANLKVKGYEPCGEPEVRVSCDPAGNKFYSQGEGSPHSYQDCGVGPRIVINGEVWRGEDPEKVFTKLKAKNKANENKVIRLKGEDDSFDFSKLVGDALKEQDKQQGAYPGGLENLGEHPLFKKLNSIFGIEQQSGKNAAESFAEGLKSGESVPGVDAGALQELLRGFGGADSQNQRNMEALLKQLEQASGGSLAEFTENKELQRLLQQALER